ncbi:MAG TPA: class I SAM-dependent methyltransferase [Methylomirabilota bacterium]|nr:class I SAM-dependent methyltransferase [Methylomirabilota bacterium]
MRRVHLIELHELPGFPSVWRDLVTDFLSFFFRVFRPYARAAPLLGEALAAAGSRRVVDLCSGAGAPVLSVLPELEALGRAPGSVVLTDLYPNLEAFRRAAAAGSGRVDFVAEPVDATAVPAHLGGFRTLFTAFHHFPPERARQVLEDARRDADGIAVFEFTERKLWLWAVPVLLIPLLAAACTPFIRPFAWRRLLFTYLLPVVPAVAGWDGLVSNLRTYSPPELLELAELDADDPFVWRAGRVPALGLSGITYLVGWRTGGS